MPKKLILNADDYGWDKNATEGILQLVEAGKIQNVTILANHCSSEDLKAIHQYSSKISCGLHVCLNEGAPLYRSIFSSLQDESGNFHTSSQLFRKAVFGKIKYTDVYAEIKAQHDYLKDHGLELTHADSHQHIHQYPFLSGMITHALSEVGIQKVRNCMPYTIYDRRRVILQGFSFFTQKNLKSFKHPDILVTDFTDLEISFEKRVPEILKSIIQSSYQTIEWMCHPGLSDRKGSYLKRQQEYDFLKSCEWDVLLKELPIELSQYKYI